MELQFKFKIYNNPSNLAYREIREMKVDKERQRYMKRGTDIGRERIKEDERG
jgi:hypothetical protein